MDQIRVGIVGYGNIGRGVEKAVNCAPDMELAAIFTRRDPQSIQPAAAGTKVLGIGEAEGMTEQIDVMILCGGSAADLRVQGPQFAQLFNTVDSFDTHAKIPEYLADMDAAAKETVALLSCGWDPGLFSMLRLLSGAVLPEGADYTFWGRGVSQGHSDAIRQIAGVKSAVQYTVPIDNAVERARSGENPDLTTREKHLRECLVVAEEGADLVRIEGEIKNMPDYFAPYDTTVTFITQEEYEKNHKKMPHGGMVVRSGNTGENKHVMEFSLTLDSNPEFTGSVLVACARAAVRLYWEGVRGAKTPLDLPLSYLSPQSREELVRELL